MAASKPAPIAYSEAHLARTALIFGLLVFALLVIAGLVLTDGVLVYPLDDPYIHLSMAEQILHGGYGINPGEYASADSSILFPLLLVPFSGTVLHPYLPLFYNAVGLGISLVLLAEIVLESGFPKNRLMLILLVFAPLALNFQGLALLGMEHMLHVAIMLLALLGLMRWLDTARLNWMLMTAILLGPLIRYESLGLSLVLSLALMLHGRAKTGTVLALGAVAPIVGFGLWLQSLGLSFLPNSVLAKAAIVGADKSAIWALLTNNFTRFGNAPYALMFVAAGLGLFVFGLLKRDDKRTMILALVASAVALGHAFLGKFGWANRYEIYALVFVTSSILVLLGPALKYRPLVYLTLFLSLLSGGYYYGKSAVLNAVYGPANIYNQQWQMGRIARMWDAPVLVNDIGLTSYQNENAIIDLYGLASKEALEARRNRTSAGWPNHLADTQNADIAMVYDRWIAYAIAPGWEPVAHLELRVPLIFLIPKVTIYATNPEAVEPVKDFMMAFASKLPKYAHLTIIGQADALQAEEHPQND